LASSIVDCFGFQGLSMDDFGLPADDFALPVEKSQSLGSVTYGEAKVVQPETKGSTINQYTTYLVQAKFGEDSFNCRKRYSDFEWVRKALISCFPGVRIPPLPKKQSAASGLLSKVAAFDDAFIEARRAGLEDFLKRCFQRKELCVDSKLLRGFLGASTEEESEAFKEKIDRVSVCAKSQKYAQIFADVQEAHMPDGQTDDEIERTCSEVLKPFLVTQTQLLRELADGFKEVVDAQAVVAKVLSGAQSKLAAVAMAESGAPFNGSNPSAARKELEEGLRKQSKAMQASPDMHYELLLDAAERELLETEAMQEAVDSVESLQWEWTAAREKAESLGNTLKNVMAGGEIPSTGTGMARMLGLAPAKDREARIETMKTEHEQKKKEVAALEEFRRLTRKVLVCREMDCFFKMKEAGNRLAVDDFAGLSAGTAGKFAGIWLGGGGGSAGYPAVVDEAPEADVEYE